MCQTNHISEKMIDTRLFFDQVCRFSLTFVSLGKLDEKVGIRKMRLVRTIYEGELKAKELTIEISFYPKAGAAAASLSMMIGSS